MAVYPGATYRPLNQFSTLGAKPRIGVVLHVNDSDGPSLYNWIKGDNNMSCHFQVAKDGCVEQYVDTDNGAWAQMAGNNTWISVETQGYPSQPLNAAQLEACAGILRWCHAAHGIPLQMSDSPTVRGFGWHGMGGAAWGGHPGCPGDLRKKQRPAILAAAALDPLEEVMAMYADKAAFEAAVAAIVQKQLAGLIHGVWQSPDADIIAIGNDPLNPTWRPGSVLSALYANLLAVKTKLGA